MSQSLSHMQRLSKVNITAKRQAGIIKLLNEYDTFHATNPGRNLPLDLFMRYFFLDHKADFDNKARNQIVDVVYTMQRYKGYLNALASRRQSNRADVITWDERFKAF